MSLLYVFNDSFEQELDYEQNAICKALQWALDQKYNRIYLYLRSLNEPSQLQINFLGNCYEAIQTVDPQADLIPLIPLGGWDDEKLCCLNDVNLIIATEDDRKILTQIEELLNQQRAINNNNSTIIKSQILTKNDLIQFKNSIVNQTTNYNQQKNSKRYARVALGGTFDRLHAGHRLLLSISALICSGEIFVGITSDKLLANKSNKELLENYQIREQNAVNFMKIVNSKIQINSGPLLDPNEPTVADTEKEMEAIVVSEESVKGAEAINRGRLERGFQELEIIVVPLIGVKENGEKLSSSGLRKIHAENQIQ